MSAPALSATGLACSRGGRLLFEALDFALDRGEALALRGPNGAGKSSLLRILAGLLAPQAGTLAWDGRDIGDEPHAHHARVAYLGALDALKPALTVAENLAHHRALRGPSRADLQAGLDAWGIAALARAPARVLSQGQRRRVALARATGGDAPLWLLDEPTIALDDDGIARLGAVLREHLATGGLAVIATHVDLPLATRLLTLGDSR
jgi:heme exporter protein A